MNQLPEIPRAIDWAAASKRWWSSAPVRRLRTHPLRAVAHAKSRWPWAFASGLVSLVGALAAVYWLATFNVPAVAPQAQSSRVLAADGRLIATLHGEEDRTIVDLVRTSPNTYEPASYSPRTGSSSSTRG